MFSFAAPKFVDIQITEWVSGDDSLIVGSAEDIQSDFVILEASLQTPQPFAEVRQHAQDTTSLFALKNVCTVFLYLKVIIHNGP